MCRHSRTQFLYATRTEAPSKPSPPPSPPPRAENNIKISGFEWHWLKRASLGDLAAEHAEGSPGLLPDDVDVVASTVPLPLHASFPLILAFTFLDPVVYGPSLAQSAASGQPHANEMRSSQPAAESGPGPGAGSGLRAQAQTRPEGTGRSREPDADQSSGVAIGRPLSKNAAISTLEQSALKQVREKGSQYPTQPRFYLLLKRLASGSGGFNSPGRSKLGELIVPD
ncbi:hypothetical protein MARPO_1089s0001 [Marchantia polymorpha]|uniref:Uncharacterized protein n=1 Tax=Marchantia polymorpha TaxID=3197 RepID=A0A2R6VY55_MARPO|nr:hypothetical protein MARPO_1089s0001 [Marchantia polymorpha]|eukprot:PTQ26536.1 hypothetical protein MARPO_1089s0001 [Marchantia polymorpha]